MIKVSATKLRNNLFTYLDLAAKGEIILVHRNNKEIVRIVSTLQPDWRDKMTIKPKILVESQEFIKPVEEIWEDYV
ncbi:toxin-antitoxin system, antitoxin component, PHD family [Desulfosarcina variabilis str. Montpellier]|jgi:prevent-host-death family protein|uniref:type II toxin-antitoxin system Phd/YefM family antitoxin n=1 Tax=Desulfosarcina variabilis TaxID=2300 RepID=UPI003AFA3398